MAPNQNPEQSARDRIGAMLAECGWVVQDKKAIDFHADPGIAVSALLARIRSESPPAALAKKRAPRATAVCPAA